MQYFLNDVWSFEKFTKSWPHWWPNLDPWTPYLWLLLYQDTSKHIRKYMGNSWNISSLEVWESNISKTSEHVCTQLIELLRFWNFELLFFEILKCWNYETLKSWKVEDEDRKMITIGQIKFTQAWIWNSYLSKNMKRTFGKS